MIFVDMEGMAGVEVWDQVSAGKPQYEETRRLMTGEVNAAVRGAKAAGATDIIVVDCHGAGGSFSFKSLLTEHLEGGATYVLGHTWCRYVEPLKEGCDAALLVGAHAMAGTPDGILCHTVSSEAWHNAWINDQLVGESGIEAAICGVWNVPVVFVSGDEATCREVTELLGAKVVTAPVKQGLGRFSAKTLSHGDACAMIEKRVKHALATKDWPEPYKPASPVKLTVELAAPEHALHFAGRQGVEVVDPRKVIATGDTFWELWDHFWYRV
jgi:D-amino peptidase